LKKRIIICATAVIFIAAVVVFIIAYLWHDGLFLPKWIDWKESQIEIDSDTSLSLADKRVTIERNGEIVWQNKKSVKVQDIIWQDINRDGEEELILLCWKIGRYGEHQPFWVKRDEYKWSQHIFIYSFSKKSAKVYPLWMASDIGMLAVDWKYNTKHDMLLFEDDKGTVTGWIWKTWGLVNAETELSLVAVGDNLIHKNIYEQALDRGSFDYLYEPVKTEISAADLAIINQETILVDDSMMYSDYPQFGTPSELAEALAATGFDLVSIANNHALDKGLEGIGMTKKAVEENDMTLAGIENSTNPYSIVYKKGISVAFLAYTEDISNREMLLKYPGAVKMLKDDDTIIEEIAMAKEAADAVVVLVHWGDEDTRNVTDSQREWARLIADAGADAIIGSHPHVLQPMEVINSSDGKNVPVYYSLGNFMSAQTKQDNLLGDMAHIKLSFTLDGICVSENSLWPLITHQSKDGYATYFADEYTEELRASNRQNPNLEELSAWAKECGTIKESKPDIE